MRPPPAPVHPAPPCHIPGTVSSSLWASQHSIFLVTQVSLHPGRSGRVDSLGRKQEWEQEQEELRLAVRRGLETVARTQARTSLLIRCLVMLLSPYEASVAPH